MSGVVFPDFMGTLSKVASFENARAQNDWITEDRAAKKAAGELIPQALGGDKEALNKVAALHPDTAMKLAPLLERLDASQRAKAKESAEFITSNGMAILNAPPEQQPQLYARVRQEAAASGRDVSTWPTQYDPGWVKFNVDKALPVAEHFKRSGEGVTFAPPAGGAPGAAPAPAGGADRSAGAIAGIESAGAPNGGYGAVGPPANEKGNRAYGKYQIMDFNVGPWTQEVLGKAMTPQEFVANPQAQDAVFKAKFGQYTQKYGSPEAAARAWFAGEGGMNNPGAKDVLGTSVQAYGSKFAQAYGPGATGAPPGMAVGADMPAADASGTPLPPAQQALAPLKGLQIPPGARVALQNGVPIVKDGNVLYLDANGGWGAAPLPTRAAPKERQLPAGYEENPDGGGLRPIVGGPADPARQRADRVPAGYRLAADGQTLEFIPGGPADPNVAKKASPMNNEQARDAGFADRMQQSNGLLSTLDTQGTDTWGRLTEMAGKSGNYLQSAEYQKFKQAKADFINAQLRRESGAAISQDEFKKADEQYFPQPGDKPEVIAQKAKNRALAVDAMIRGAGPSYKVGGGVDAGTPVPAPAAAPAPAQGSADRGRALFEARDAIAKGAPREKVIERLRSMGIEEAP